MLSNALLRLSGVMFIQSGIPDKNCAIGPDWAVGNYLSPASISCAISGYVDLEGKKLWCRPQYRCNIVILLIVPALSMLYTICRTWCGHAPAPPTGPTPWSSTRLDGVYSCVHVLAKCGDQMPWAAAVARPWYVWNRSADCRPARVGSPDFKLSLC